MNRKQNTTVSVCVITYNQEKWIRQTLDSILAQQTEYPFEVIIGEDHGTDGTRSICQEYADKYKNVMLLPETVNMGVTANWIRCVQAGNGKYIMTCAGDDYWHNPKKIQMQVDLMEAHPECLICHTDIDEYNDNTDNIIQNAHKKQGIVCPQGRILKEVLSGRANIAAVTMCIRRDAFEQYVPAEEFSRRRFPREDWPTQLVLAAHGDILYISESTATYRVGQESITNTSNYEKIIRRTKQDKKMTAYLYSLIPELGLFKDGPFYDVIGYHYAMQAAYKNNDYKAAHKYALLDKYPNAATYCAYTWLSFKLYRFFKMR